MSKYSRGAEKGRAAQTAQAQAPSDTQIALRVCVVSIVINLVLSLLKILAGIFAHSSAMVSDGFHSASDVCSSVIVIFGIRLAAQKADRTHPYGHERFECVAAIVLAVILLFTGLTIAVRAVSAIKDGNVADALPPGLPAAGAAVLSIAVKEGLFWYTRAYARKIGSSALMADAWHHRSDALSSVGALAGILGARQGFLLLEPLASFFISILIMKTALEIFADAVRKMVDHACPEEVQAQMEQCILAQSGVLGIDLLRTRMFGSRIYVDLEIAVDGQQTVAQGHETAQQVHDAVEQNFPAVKHIMVHVNPCAGAHPACSAFTSSVKGAKECAAGRSADTN